MGKRVPMFWWDFAYDPDRVIVESDDPKFPIVKSWVGHSMAAQDAALQTIKDIQEGRADYRRL